MIWVVAQDSDSGDVSSAYLALALHLFLWCQSVAAAIDHASTTCRPYHHHHHANLPPCFLHAKSNDCSSPFPSTAAMARQRAPSVASQQSAPEQVCGSRATTSAPH